MDCWLGSTATIARTITGLRVEARCLIEVDSENYCYAIFEFANPFPAAAKQLAAAAIVLTATAAAVVRVATTTITAVTLAWAELANSCSHCWEQVRFMRARQEVQCFAVPAFLKVRRVVWTYVRIFSKSKPNDAMTRK